MGCYGGDAVDGRVTVRRQENLGVNASGVGGRGGGHEAYRVEKTWEKEMVMEWLGGFNHQANPKPPE